MPDEHDDDAANPAPVETPVNPAAEAFYSGAFARITRVMSLLAVLAIVAVWLRWGTAVALGMAVGCLVGFVNFVWLKRIVAAMADRLTQSRVGEPRPSNRAMVARYLQRYVFIAAVAYAIFRSSPASFWGFLAGLFLPVPAVFCEAAYEFAVSLKRGI